MTMTNTEAIVGWGGSSPLPLIDTWTPFKMLPILWCVTPPGKPKVWEFCISIWLYAYLFFNSTKSEKFGSSVFAHQCYVNWKKVEDTFNKLVFARLMQRLD
jgi:hypothetical protein